MQGSLKSLVRGVIPQSVREWRWRRIAARHHAKLEALPLRAKFDHIYRTGLWGRADGGLMSSGDGSRDAAVVLPYIATVSAVLDRLPRNVRLVDIGAGDFSVGQQLLPKVGSYVACDISSAIVAQNQERYGDEGKVEFRVLDATEEPLPDGDVVTFRQVLQHLSNAQIAQIVPKLSAYAAAIVTEAVPDAPEFIANVDHRPGFSTRLIESNSGVDLEKAPFHLQCAESRVLCEPRAGAEQVPGRIRTTLYITEKGRALGL